MTNKYRIICVLDSVNDSDKTLSTMDASPEYLHIHILKSNSLESIDEFASQLSPESNNHNLYQWGIPFEKDAKIRTAQVNSGKTKEYGQIGIGSAAIGDEKKESFSGGGEGFMFNNSSFRVTRGNEVFPVGDDGEYWTFQSCDFNGSNKIDDFKGLEVNGRDDLMNKLKEKSGGKPFVAVFDAEFQGDFLARSNGVFPDDEVADRIKNVFDIDIEGGHLLGGSSNKGDLDSLSSYSLSASASEIDFSLIITSDVLLKEVHNLRIFKKDCELRLPRTKIEVNEAAKLIQETFRNQILK